MENESILVSVFPLAFTVVDHFTTLPLPLWDYFTLLKKRGNPMMNKRAPRRSDEEWHQIILAARASGLSDFGRHWGQAPMSSTQRQLKISYQKDDITKAAENLNTSEKSLKKAHFNRAPLRNSFSGIDFEQN
ncbi:hypothetical protein [Oribacterium sp. HCP3S3_B9]|uniref:hypothetical protein n=1 Tax=Oribacterium sp. HCP3S3_B9 TaxID=3438946 RepID=UPI003F89E814